MAFTTAMHAGDWMKNLPDNIYISQLSIPGTHDSGTGNGVALAAFSQCQDIPVSQQWAAGIRAFDLRPKVKGSYININHGIAPPSCASTTPSSSSATHWLRTRRSSP